MGYTLVYTTKNNLYDNGIKVSIFLIVNQTISKKGATYAKYKLAGSYDQTSSRKS